MWESEKFWGTIDFIVFFCPTIKVNGAPEQPGYKLSSKYLPLCSAEQNKFIQVWNYLRVSKLTEFLFLCELSLVHYKAITELINE